MDNRDELVERLKAKLDIWNAEIDRLEANAKKVTAESKERYAGELAAVRKMRDQAGERLTSLREASGEAWEAAAAGAERAWSELKEALESARASFDKEMK